MKLSYNFKIKKLQPITPLKLKFKLIKKLLNPHLLKPFMDKVNLKRHLVQKYSDQILMGGLEYHSVRKFR